MVADAGGAENLAHKQRAEADLDAEVRACAEMLADEKMAGGIPADEAQRRALAELGGRNRLSRRCETSGREPAWRSYGRTCGLDCGNCAVRRASLSRGC